MSEMDFHEWTDRLAEGAVCHRCLKAVCGCPSLDQVPHLPGDDLYLGDDGQWRSPSQDRFERRPAAVADLDVADGAESASTWRPVDLAAVLDGTWQPPAPTVGRRSDGRGLLYPGRIHTVAGESEAGKGWLFVALVLAELDAGNAIAYVDFEDEAGAVVGRMLAASAKRDQLRDQFAYIRPEGPIGALGGRGDLAQALGDLGPSVVLLDGVTEAMGLHGLDPLKNAEVAAFGRMLPRAIAQQGPAVLASDHVTKNGEGRGRYAIGAVHKLNAVDGAAYLIDNRRPFGVGLTGRSTLMLAKDRPGALRQHARPSSGGLHWYADLVMVSHDATFVEVELTPPSTEPPRPFRPTTLMGRVTDALQRAGGPLNVSGIRARMQAKAADVQAAVAALVDEGYVAVDDGPRGAKLHRLIRPFGEDQS